MGLFFGAVTSFLGIVAYFFNGWHIGQGSLFFIIFGILGVVFGLLQFPLLKKRRRFIRFFLNAFFVFGASLILIGIDALLHNLFIDLFLVLLTVFWLFTRIALSQWDHKRICQTCEIACEFHSL
jgi:energy-converting hydrogenase Eha subunit A